MPDVLVEKRQETTPHPLPAAVADAAPDVLQDPLTVTAQQALPEATDPTAAADVFALPPEARAGLLELSTATDPARVEALTQELHTSWGIPLGTLQAVVEGDDGLWDDVGGLVDGGAWHDVTLGADGGVEGEVEITKESARFEGTDQRLDLSYGGDPTATWAHKPSGTTIEAGARDGGGFASARFGDEQVTHEVGASYAGTTQEGDLTWKRTEGDVSQEHALTVSGAHGGLGLGYETRTSEGEDRSTGWSVEAHHHEQATGGSFERTEQDGEASSRTRLAYDVEDGAHEVALSRDVAQDAERSTSLGITGAIGPRGGGATLTTSEVDGDASTSTELAYELEDGTHTVGVKRAVTEDEDHASSWGLSASVGGGEERLSGDFSRRDDDVLSKGSMKLELGDDKAVSGDLSHTFGVGDARDLTVGIAGDYAFANKPAERDAWSTTLTLGTSSGPEEARTRHSLSLTAGEAEGAAIGDRLGLGELGLPLGAHGSFASLGTTSTWGSTSRLETGLSVARVDELLMGSLSAEGSTGVGEGSTLDVDLFAGAAKVDDELAGLLSFSAELSAEKGWSLGAGGSYQVTPGVDGYDELWHAWSSAGYRWNADQAITIKAGIAGTGERVVFVPEVAVDLSKDAKLAAIGAFGDQTASVGGRLSLPGGISVIGGYGDMGALMNPYAGNKGMQLAPFENAGNTMGWGGAGGGQGFVGVQADVLEIARRFGFVK